MDVPGDGCFRAGHRICRGGVAQPFAIDQQHGLALLVGKSPHRGPEPFRRVVRRGFQSLAARHQRMHAERFGLDVLACALAPEVASRVITLFRDVRPPEHADYELTPHETRLLELLVEGHNYKTAAEELGVSVTTIASSMRNVYGKLQAVAMTRT